jgi:energy-coupling factor transporter ATP-binding protein EcfA2
MRLVADAVCYSWPSRCPAKPAVLPISAEFEGGLIHLICGPSGSGKSTLSLLLAGLLGPDSGIVQLNGEPVAGQRARIAYSFQFPETVFFEDSVAAELAHLSPNSAPTDTEVFTRLGLSFAELAPQHPYHLSAGYGRLTAIALQLSRRPDVLILDEPTAGLDWEFHSRMLRVLKEYSDRNHILIVVTHDTEVMRKLGGRAWVMNRGALARSGPTEELLQDPVQLTSFGLQE